LKIGYQLGNPLLDASLISAGFVVEPGTPDGHITRAVSFNLCPAIDVTGDLVLGEGFPKRSASRRKLAGGVNSARATGPSPSAEEPWQVAQYSTYSARPRRIWLELARAASFVANNTTSSSPKQHRKLINSALRQQFVCMIIDGLTNQSSLHRGLGE
jgi:hypothetical protein